MKETRDRPILTPEQEEELIRVHRTLKDKRKAYRINAIILLGRGYSRREVERILLIDRKSITRYIKDYRKGGIERLLRDDYVMYSGKLTDAEKKILQNDLKMTVFPTAKAICEHVKKKFRKSYTNDGMIKLLHSLGFSYKKTKVVPAKADREKQEKFVGEYQGLRENIGENEKIYFLDATHPVHNNLPGYGWIKTGEEQEIKTTSGRQRISINGVYSPMDHEVIVREDDTVSYASNIELFKKIEELHPELKYIYIIHDNARYNHSKALRAWLENSRIKMIPLPSYSPNLNLIERLWKLMKKLVLYNKYHEDFDDFHKAINNFFNKWIPRHTEVLESLMKENFHLYEMKA